MLKTLLMEYVEALLRELSIPARDVDEVKQLVESILKRLQLL
ncbi:MAG: hypothetical protein OWQ51_02670 [Pyrobaculum arsenaticum]|nr:hypothetical protein [Pyrobaculum arsenaticum]